MPITGYKSQFEPSVPVVVANGQQISATLYTGGFGVVGIFLPAALTSTTLTFLGCATSGGTFLPVYNSSGLVSYTVAQGRYVSINSLDLQGLAYIQINMGSAEGAARTLNVALKGVY